MELSNHGSHAKVGDIVELLNPSGHRTGIISLVTETFAKEVLVNRTGVAEKYLVLLPCHAMTDRRTSVSQWKANFCRIISRA